ncbi:MAG: PqqD family protein [Nitrososphaerota archaeon]|nr:PqqD family protein [Candidatus Bathyarchaeota archaeon]MDW8048850.1 PqqD family protein [Nitrososphaerota archaeon]
MVLGRLLGRKKPKPAEIPRSEFLKMKPVRNPVLKFEKNKEGNTVIIIPLQRPEEGKSGGKKRRSILDSLAPPPKERRIELDSVGSIVWDLCDGEHTIEDIARYLNEKYKMLLSEAEVSLNTYFNQLSQKGLVGFIVPEETRARLEELSKKETEKKGKRKFPF